MRDHREKTHAGGTGFLGLLALLFIALKLCGVIDWPWGWVLAPLWAPWALVAALALVSALLDVRPRR